MKMVSFENALNHVFFSIIGIIFAVVPIMILEMVKPYFHLAIGYNRVGYFHAYILYNTYHSLRRQLFDTIM
jgi:hypothetical protein